MGEYTAFKSSKVALPQWQTPPYTEEASGPVMTSIRIIASIVALLALQLVFLNRSEQLCWRPIVENASQYGTREVLRGPTVSRDPVRGSVGNLQALGRPCPGCISPRPSFRSKHSAFSGEESVAATASRVYTMDSDSVAPGPETHLRTARTFLVRGNDSR